MKEIMYIVINNELGMSKGKIAAQVSHAAVRASHIYKMLYEEKWKKWFDVHSTKIVLKSDEATMIKILSMSSIITAGVRDEGRTEVAPGSLTALALVPMERERVPDIIKEMKLL